MSITRRRFVQAAGVAVLTSACGDDSSPRPDTSGTDTAPEPDTSIDDTFDAAPDVEPETVAETTVATEVTPDVEPDTGLEPIGRFDPSTLTEAAADFVFGVQAGDPHIGGAVLWTRYTGDESLELVVFEGPLNDEGDLYLREPAIPSESGFTHVEVDGLQPDTRYRYCFVVTPAGGAPTRRSKVGTFRTAPPDRSLRPITFGGVSCVNQSYRPYRTLTRAGEAELDFFILSGDTAYMDGAESLADYRDLWRQALDTDGYRGVLGSTGNYSTWDDHEVYDNWDPERIDPQIYAYAKQTYLEHSALRLDPAATGWKIWRSQRWGKTLEVFVLDCRSERLRSTRFSDDAIYLSRAQMDWLKQGLRESPCVFKLIVNSVPITDMPSTFPGDKDRWEGYPPQRLEILSHIQGPPAIERVLWLSGDFHFGAVARVDPFGKRFDDAFEVFMGQGANMPNPAWPALEGLAQFPFVTGTNNYVRFTCDPSAEPPAITAEFIDGDGNELYRHVFTFGA